MVDTPTGKIPIVRTKLQSTDILGSWSARWGIRRMSYRVEPRLYAVGNPTDASPVFVTANYKMSFDRLRSQLSRIDGWILVLDTKGINVWCAAGKGTFGTAELVNRIEAVGLQRVVSHRRLIVPQRGATGVSAHLVRERSGFHVIYGPVRAEDIPAFMQSGMSATPEMRRVTFGFRDRIVLVPVDIVSKLKYAIFAAACFLLLSGLGPGVYSLDRVARYGIINTLFPLLAVLCGAVLPAALLPWLPGRAFSVKGAVTGILPVLGIVLLLRQHPETFRNWLSAASWLVLFPAVTSFIGMNFTGSSTYTSLSGVKKEMRFSLPVQIGAAVCGLALWVAGLYV
jgi:acetyl-CoA decarbonylase/synthase complex subunit gamma